MRTWTLYEDGKTVAVDCTDGFWIRIPVVKNRRQIAQFIVDACNAAEQREGRPLVTARCLQCSEVHQMIPCRAEAFDIQHLAEIEAQVLDNMAAGVVASSHGKHHCSTEEDAPGDAQSL